MENRPKIEVVRVSSVERGNFRPLDGIQLRAAYSHVRIGTYCPEPEIDMTPCENKPPSQSRKFKKNLGPVSRLLRRRHQGTCLATKSCDNIYNVNRNSSSLDWRLGQCPTDSALNARQSSSLDWRMGRRINSDWHNTSCSTEHLHSRSPNINISGLRTPTAKSKIVSLLRRLSPRLPRPTSRNSLASSPVVCPWIRVEYSTESMNDQNHDESQENDFQRELQLNELKKRMAGASPSFCNSQVPGADTRGNQRADVNQNVQEDLLNVEKCPHRSVNEERKREEDNQRRRPRSSNCHSEVAGLEEENGNDTKVTVVPGGGGSGGSSGRSSSRRNRPLSLAVQPLNYQRLDPDTIINKSCGNKHPNMTSQESIGSCSLDVDRSASDRSEATVDSVSERTLHSLNLSNGDTASPGDNPVNGSSETISKNQEKSPDKDNINGDNETEQLTAKKPSYLGLACSISGYSGITRYDSKLREGFRSRDSSPGSRLITRETSPAGFRSSENLGVPTKSQSISPLAMDRQNGFSNGNKECRVETFVERTSLSTCQGYSEVDKGVSLHSFAEISPIRGSPSKRITQVTTCRETLSSSMSVSSPRPSNNSNLSNLSMNECNSTNGSLSESDNNKSLNSSCEKSFIQQRVERLYGPGALAQGFFFKRSLNQSNFSDSSFNKSSNNNDSFIDNANTEESLKNLPVLRHLRPEFRAQLPVVNPRRPTDGSEQVIKPLSRISLNSRKNDAASTPPIPSINITGNESLKLSASVTSIPDHQPAAPEVVLPVLETTVNTASITESKNLSQESLNIIVKDGHYFMKLLKAEIERLFLLAASAEAELTNGQQLPEEAAGKLRSAAGKARLLATQKMQQFEGLCQKNINQVPGEEFPTTNEDLAGFWDMVMLQVVQVNDLFDHIDKLKRSQWQEILPEKSTASSQNGSSSKRRTLVSQKPKQTPNTEANRKAREAREQARRQMMEERRKAMKSSQVQQSVEIFAPKT